MAKSKILASLETEPSDQEVWFSGFAKRDSVSPNTHFLFALGRNCLNWKRLHSSLVKIKKINPEICASDGRRYHVVQISSKGALPLELHLQDID